MPTFSFNVLLRFWVGEFHSTPVQIHLGDPRRGILRVGAPSWGCGDKSDSSEAGEDDPSKFLGVSVVNRGVL